MSLKTDLLAAIASDARLVRDLFVDEEVLTALSGVGIGGRLGIQVLELHAPGSTARKAVGLGTTACNRQGIRHSVVTCTPCLKKLAKTQV